MHSTYINDLQDVAYPLLGDAARPFPDSVLTGMGICFADTVDSTYDVSELHISQITISSTFVDVILTHGSSLVGTFTVYYRTSKIANLDAVDENYSGYLCVGIVPDTCYGTYIGNFKIDPDCIRRDVVRDVYDSVSVDDGDPVSVGEALTIKPYGDLYIEETVSGQSAVNLTLKCSSDRRLGTGEFTKVVTVNGANDGEQLRSLAIVVSDPSIPAQLSAPVVRIDSKTITVVLEGTTSFPHCYDTSDQAGEWVNEPGVL